MGCAESASVSEVSRKRPRPGYAVESFPREKKLPPNRRERLKEKSRRTPEFKIPKQVIAPSVAVDDIGCHIFRSMASSPKRSLIVPTKQFPSKNRWMDDIDDIEEPPNYETQGDYIANLDEFMWDVKVHPELLSCRISELRSAMSGEFACRSEDEVDTQWTVDV
jgi:hypothetical protein